VRRCVARYLPVTLGAVGVLGALAGCGKAAPGSGAPPPATHPEAAVTGADTGPLACEPVDFAISSPVPEASGSAWMTIDGKLAMVVVSDSGNDGAYAILDPDTGETREQGKLPLGNGGKGSDDIEGLDARGDMLYGLSSPGWMRVWRRVPGGFELVDGPYPIGEVTLPPKGGMGDKPPEGDGMVCPGTSTNCGRNYEGLCLAHQPAAGCVGFAAAKADGHVYCLTEDNGRFVAHHERAIAITQPGFMADCTFSDTNALWVGNNMIGLLHVYRVDGWQDPAHAKVVDVAQIGLGFPEVISVRGDMIYRFSDTGGSPSLLAKFRCKPIAR
jgi:hypothetical protein